MMGGNPTDWWSMMMMMDGTTAMHSQSSSSSSSSSSQNLYGSSNSLADNHNSTQDFPRSWSQLLLGGLGGESEKFGMMTSPSPLQHKKMENWEDLQTLQNNNNNPSSSSSSLLRPPFAADNIKQEFPLQINLGRHHHMAAASSLSTHSNNVFNIPSSGIKVGDLDSCKNQHDYYSSECNSTSSGGPSKKPRVHHSSSQPSLKVRKEKLGDRITALHQIVSPFGKTDTASVLSEAIGYIRFLHSQIQALSTPYMGNNPSAGSMARHSHQQSLYVLGKDIRPDYTKKAIRLRLVRTYIVPEGRNTEVIKSQECLFHDCEGTYVHGSIPKQYVPQFTNVLQEGQVYAIKNFLVISNYYQYKTTEHRYMIKFNHETEVQRHRRKSFPNLIFRLKSFDDLISGVVSDKQIIDVIGRVVEFYSPKDKIIAGHPSKLVDFLIEDAKGNRIKCTLWDDHVEAVMPFFNAHVDGPLIILLQLCRAKRVDNEVRISSSYTATKVWFNHDCKEFTDFKASLKVDHTPLRSINSMSMLSYGNSVDNNSKTPVIVSTIIDLYGRAEEGHYFVPAKIVGLESGRHWYYTSCSAKGCFKKLDPNQGSLKCDKCFVSCPEITLRYRLIVRVVDKTSDAPLLLWDKECTELIGMSAFDLKSKYSQDDSEIPTELESLRNKAMVFKVSIKDEHLKNPAKPIPVLKITNDQELVSVYCPSLTDDHDELSKMIGEELQDEESDDSESGDEASSPAVQQSLKAIREDSSEKVEPGAIKRCLLDQFSSSQDVKRSKAFIIKQEKN